MTIKEEQVCERFKEIRNSLKMKQGDFAKEIKLTQGHVSDIENKRKTVSDRVIEILCLKYGFNEDWIRYGKEPKKKETDGSFSELLSNLEDSDDTFIKTIIKIYMELDEDSKSALRKIAQKMSEKYDRQG